MKWLMAVLLVCLAGCSARRVPPTVVRIVEPVEVKVPILVRAVPPPELLVPIHPPLPVFIDPTDPAASSALTVEGERLLRGLIEELIARRDAWIAWAMSVPASTPVPSKPPVPQTSESRAIDAIPWRLMRVLR